MSLGQVDEQEGPSRPGEQEQKSRAESIQPMICLENASVADAAISGDLRSQPGYTPKPRV